MNRLAGEWQQKIPYRPLNKSRREYLRRIDGIVYGDDPRQGFVENNIFYHPQMRFQFPVPREWKLVNMPTVVQMAAPDQKAYIQFTVASEKTPAAAADKFVTNNKVTVLKRQNTRVNGFPAVIVEAKHVSETQTIHVLTYFIRKGQNVFIFQGLSLEADYAARKNAMVKVAAGFRNLTNPKALNKKPARVRIVSVKRAGDFKSTMRSFGMKNKFLPELSILNGVEETARFKKGDLIKIIREQQ